VESLNRVIQTLAQKSYHSKGNYASTNGGYGLEVPSQKLIHCDYNFESCQSDGGKQRGVMLTPDEVLTAPYESHRSPNKKDRELLEPQEPSFDNSLMVVEDVTFT